MKISARGLKLVKEFEGCKQSIGNGRFVPYVCPAGVLTIGWGHTNHHGRQFKAGDVWTQAECDQQLADDMSGFEQAVERLVKVPLTQNQFDALVSFTYNCGEGNLGKSTLLRKLNKKDYAGAAEQFAVWNKGGGKVLRGLTRRRAAEAALFRAPSLGVPSRPAEPNRLPPAAPPVAPEPMPQQVDVPREDKPSIFEKLWAWLAATPVGAGVAYLTDWRVVAVIVVALLIVGGFTVWLMGLDNVRAWVRRKVNR